MRTDLERQLVRFAEALDQQAPALSLDEISGRGAVAIDLDGWEGTTWEHRSRLTSVAGADPKHNGESDGESEAVIELAPSVTMRSSPHHVGLKFALAVAAAVVVVVALASIGRHGTEREPADVPTSTVQIPLPSMPTAPSTTVPTTPPPTRAGSSTSGGMWPQATLEEVRAAQQLADAGDPAYTWQVDSQLFVNDSWVNKEPGQIELVDRFLREVLGWESYVLNPWDGMVRGNYYDVFYDQRYLRCAPGRTNPLYPPGPEPDWGELCAPTLDDLRYESVSLNLAQLDRQDSNGIWVVTDWELIDPFAQADPRLVEARARERLGEFLDARIAGSGAEGLVQTGPDVEVPLLYATTSGAPYERYEIELVDGPQWPFGGVTFSVRLYANSDTTVVEQQISWNRSQSGGLAMDPNATTENGEPVTMSYTSSDGDVTLSAPSTWEMWWPGAAHVAEVGVWFGGLWRSEESFGSGERIEFVDPVAYDSWCAANGGSPLLSAPADADAIAQQLITDPNFETTEPTTAQIGGAEAVLIDVALAPNGRTCGIGMIEIARWIHALEADWRLRLYLVDLPDGVSTRTVAITVVAPDARFEEVVAETAPIIESISFQS